MTGSLFLFSVFVEQKAGVVTQAGVLVNTINAHHIVAAAIDTNGDLCGNRCDADWDNNGGTGGTDFATWAASFGQTAPGPPFNPDIDTDLNGGIGPTRPVRDTENDPGHDDVECDH